jgi:hypothetical protein
MYKWVDEKGVTHFSQTPPPAGQEAVRVAPRVAAPPAAGPRPDDASSWRTKEMEFRRRQVERARQEDAAAKAREQRAKECVRARQRLASLEEERRVYRRDDRGNRVYLSDEERAEATVEQRRRVREACD